MKYLVFISILFLLNGCYSFKGISIPPEIKTYYVEDYTVDPVNAILSPQNIEITFAEALRARVRNESRLNYDTEDPHIIFSGIISRYKTSPAAPIEGESTLLNRLDISVKVSYEDITNEENNWNKTYSAFEDFPSTEVLSAVEEELIARIFEEMTERIFNDSFTNW